MSSTNASSSTTMTVYFTIKGLAKSMPKKIYESLQGKLENSTEPGLTLYDNGDDLAFGSTNDCDGAWYAVRSTLATFSYPLVENFYIKPSSDQLDFAKGNLPLFNKETGEHRYWFFFGEKDGIVLTAQVMRNYKSGDQEIKLGAFCFIHRWSTEMPAIVKRYFTRFTKAFKNCDQAELDNIVKYIESDENAFPSCLSEEECYDEVEYVDAIPIEPAKTADEPTATPVPTTPNENSYASKAKAPEPVPEPAPVVQVPVTAPVVPAPVTAPVVQVPESAPVVQVPVTAPVTQVPAKYSLTLECGDCAIETELSLLEKDVRAGYRVSMKKHDDGKTYGPDESRPYRLTFTCGANIYGYTVKTRTADALMIELKPIVNCWSCDGQSACTC